MEFKKLFAPLLSLLSLNLFLDAQPIHQRRTPSKKVTATSSRMNYKEIKNKEDFDQYIKNGSGLHVVKFYADWCGSCKEIRDMYNKLAGKYRDQMHFSAVDIEEKSLKSVLAEYKISAVPTIIFFNDGKEIAKERGAMKESDLDAKIKNVIDQRNNKK